MTNTIPNVPRELLERLANTSVTDYEALGKNKRELRAILSAPSPAGVDGLEVVAWSVSFPSWQGTKVYEQRQEWAYRTYGDIAYTVEDLCRLSDAQAIINGLRGENEALHAQVKVLQSDANSWQSGYDEGRRMGGKHCALTMDQQAQRIGELEAALEFACKSLAQVTSSDGSGHADIAVSVLRMAGRKEADASQIVEAYKAGAKWRIDAALSAGKGN